MKYGNRKTEIDGIVFDSKKEASRFLDLKLLESGGAIQNLRRQVKYELIPSQRISGKTERGVSYIADFVYDLEGKTIVEDVKGMKTDVYKLKRKLMKYIHGIDIQEV